MRLFVLILFLGYFTEYRSQNFCCLDTVGLQSQTNNIYSKRLNGDSLSTAFCIVIKQEVKSHKHLKHSEQVLVLEGEARMKLGNEEFRIAKGDLIFIPCNTYHSVKSTSDVPLKVLSIQSPAFDGSDRVIETTNDK